tara:strand:- start:1564 stop:2427 length:864 start_codon:yes stop_codon:yes gene_type:complete
MEKTESLKKILDNFSIGIVCHDSGGAEILSSFVKLNQANYNFTLSGPALSIFRRKIKNFKNIALSKNLKISDKIITGSGLGSNLEYNAIVKSKKLGKSVYTFLDHWINYRQRFIRKKKKIYPDEIWVGDVYAKQKAIKFYKNIKLIKNPFFFDTKKTYKKNHIIKNKNQILFVSSNTDRLKSKKTNDRKIFNRFLNYKLNYFPKHKILLRLHPSENKKKYNIFLKKKSNITFDQNKELAKSLKSSIYVFGHNSMVLPIANLCGIKTFNILCGKKSTIPKIFISKILK